MDLESDRIVQVAQRIARLACQTAIVRAASQVRPTLRGTRGERHGDRLFSVRRGERKARPGRSGTLVRVEPSRPVFKTKVTVVVITRERSWRSERCRQTG